MNVLIFTDEDAQTLIANQTGQHRLAPIKLTDGKWFLMEDILAETSEGMFKNKLNVPYVIEPFENIESLIPVSEEILEIPEE